MLLKDKNAIVTGGSKGIGRAIAVTLAQQGANVVINYLSSEAEALAVVEEIKAMGRQAFAVKANISKKDEAEQLILKANEYFKRIDILVNNAGITRDNLIIRMTENEFDEVMDTNLKGAFFCSKFVTKYMIKQRYGKIINISSVAGVTGNIGQVNYSASKAGLIGMTKSLAKELASRNITVNAVAPGFIDSDMTDKLTDRIKEEHLKGIPLMRAGALKDVANGVLFLASELSDYITGQVINIDGGMVI